MKLPARLRCVVCVAPLVALCGAAALAQRYPINPPRQIGNPPRRTDNPPGQLSPPPQTGTPPNQISVLKQQPPASTPSGPSRSGATSPASTSSAQPSPPPELLPGDWWTPAIRRPIGGSENAIVMRLDNLLVSALRHSPQVRVFSDLPLIRETAIIEADAAFDWHAFMEAAWDDISEPVGSTLTTGGPPRFRDQKWRYSAGLRRRNRLGGRFEASQQLGYRDNNSIYFIPHDQGTARLTLGYTQPLLRRAGKVYNTSLTVLAELDTAVAGDEFHRQLQSHLLEVTRAYWSLYLERGAYLQRRKLLERGRQILSELESRRAIDTLESQIVRVRSDVLTREAELVRAVNAVRNAEARVLALVDDPQLNRHEFREFVTIDPPTSDLVPLDMQHALAVATQHRPEVGQAIKQIQAGAIRVDMSKNELLPMLNLVLETYLSGLRGDSDIGGAFNDQFNTGRPSYSVGLQFEVPLHRRADRARLQRRQLELRQLESQFRVTIKTLRLEVGVAVREVETALKELDAKRKAAAAAATQLEFVASRWRLLPGVDQRANFALEDLLAAQDRLTDAEFGLLSAHVTYNLALMNLKKATGTLLHEQRVTEIRFDGELPQILLDKERTHGR